MFKEVTIKSPYFLLHKHNVGTSLDNLKTQKHNHIPQILHSDSRLDWQTHETHFETNGC